MPFHKNDIQMSLFPRAPKSESQNWNFYHPITLDIHIFSNQIYFENVKAISYTPSKGFSNNVWHSPIGIHLTFDFKGFVMKNQVFNLIPTLFF